MDSLISQHTFPEREEIDQTINDLVALFESSDPTTFIAPESTKALLNTRGKRAYILKKQKRNPDNSPHRSDSFVIGVPLGKNILGIKIHPDYWIQGKIVYENPALLKKLIAGDDIPNILRSINIEGFRAVFYIWERSSILPYHIRKYPDRVPQIQIALKNRIASLTSKGIILSFSEPSDFIYSPDTKTAKLLDINKLQVPQKKGRVEEENEILMHQRWLRVFLDKK